MSRSAPRAGRPTLVRRLLGRLVPVAVALAATGTLLTLGGSEPGYQPTADLTQFDPGNIISNEVFFFGRALSEAQIQSFIDSKGATCVTGSDGTPCLKVYRQDTVSRPADAQCGGYVGAPQERAATIIAKVAASCNVSPKVLLVMLQKERGLIRASGSGLDSGDYRIAMGYGCPDTAPCDAEYFGFQNQVYKAAWQMQRYAHNPNNYFYKAGQTVNIQWSPNAACGSGPVHIENQATAGLYIYTPYQPNAGALNGHPDSCSEYGNRNFWSYFTDWFISTQSDAIAAASPKGEIDNLGLTPSGFTAWGWAVDPDSDGPVTMRATVDGSFVGSVQADAARPDVGTALGVGPNHGYGISGLLSYGTHQVCILADNLSGLGATRELGCQSLTFTNRKPLANIDIDPFTERPDGSVVVTGWSYDPDGTPAEVHVYVEGVATVVRTGIARPDVQAAYPSAGPNAGFSATVGPVVGGAKVCAYSVDTVAAGNNWLLGCKTMSYRAPIGWVDSVAETPAGQLRLSGWTLDTSAPLAPVDVHVYVDGRVVTGTQASLTRDDVGRTYPSAGPAHGFDVTIPVAAGKHEVCAFAINLGVVGQNPLLGCRTLTLQYVAPEGHLDAVRVVGGGKVDAYGWALDRSIPTAPVTVHYYVDGVFKGAVEATGERLDVGAVFPTAGSRHGFASTLDVGLGRHQVCAYAINIGMSGSNPSIGCSTVEVTDLAPIGSVDSIARSGPGDVTLWGWTFDPDAPTATVSVHVLVDGVDRGAFPADGPRADIGSAYPAAGGAHGFGATLSVSAGQHEVCVTAPSTAGQATPATLRCARVTV
jgi:hypothetical protein